MKVSCPSLPFFIKIPGLTVPWELDDFGIVSVRQDNDGKESQISSVGLNGGDDPYSRRLGGDF